jgi:ABC-type phosphate transport system permease subunit
MIVGSTLLFMAAVMSVSAWLFFRKSGVAFFASQSRPFWRAHQHLSQVGVNLLRFGALALVLCAPAFHFLP